MGRLDEQGGQRPMDYQDEDPGYYDRVYLGPPSAPADRYRRLGRAQARHLEPGLVDQPRDRQPLIASAAIDQNTALEALWQAIQTLEDRLQPVLAPVLPQTQGTQGAGGVAPATVLPPLAEQLQIATRKIQTAEFKIRELIDRVEV